MPLLGHTWHFRIPPRLLWLAITAEGRVPALAPSPTLPLLILAFVTTALYNAPFSLVICTVTDAWCLKDKNPTRER